MTHVPHHQPHSQVIFALNSDLVNSLVCPSLFTFILTVQRVSRLRSHSLMLACTHSHTRSQGHFPAETQTLSTRAHCSHLHSLYYVCHVTDRTRSCLCAPIFALILPVPLASSHLCYMQHKVVPTGTKW